MIWWIGPRVRCDLVAYSGVNLTGVRRVVQIFPTGSRKGTFRTDELKSSVVLAPVGVRVVYCTSDDPNRWEEAPWRCVRMVEGHRFTNEQKQSGVRLPDLHWQTPPEAKRVDPDRQTGFRLVSTLAEAAAVAPLEWTFGRSGTLHDRIRAIRVEREEEPWAPPTE